MKVSPEGFECSKCGQCCTGFGDDFGVFVFDFEVAEIARTLQLSSETFIDTYLTPYQLLEKPKRVQIYQLKHIEGNCVFLKNKLCGIHSVKPAQCQRGPFGFFWDGNKRYSCMTGDISNGWSSSQLDKDFIATNFSKEEQQMAGGPASNIFSSIQSLLSDFTVSFVVIDNQQVSAEQSFLLSGNESKQSTNDPVKEATCSEGN